MAGALPVRRGHVGDRLAGGLPVPARTAATFAPDGPPERGSLAVILADRRFLLFLGSAVFAWLMYVAYEIVLPVSLVDGYGYQPAAWGFLVWVNPLLVALFQVRLTRAHDARCPRRRSSSSRCW